MTSIINKRNYTHFGHLDPSQKTFGNLFKDAGYATEDVSTISYLADMAWEIAERRRMEEEREELQLQLAQLGRDLVSQYG